MNGYIHVSFDPVDKFVPRVPGCRMLYEDGTTKRICVGTDIVRCLNSMPEGVDTLGAALKELDGPFVYPVLHVYTLWTEEIAYRPTAKEVPDVEMSQERWLLEEPEYVTREDLMVTRMETVLPAHEPFKEDKLLVTSLQYRRTGAKVENMDLFLEKWFPGNPNRGFIAAYLKERGYRTADLASWGWGFEVVMKMLDRDGLLHIGLAGMQKGA